MRSATLQLTLTGPRFSLTPISPHVQAPCTAEAACRHEASHRLLSRSTAAVGLLCDAHTLEWAVQNGYRVTTARIDESVA